MMYYHDFLSKLFLKETTEIEQWPDTFQSCSQFIESTVQSLSEVLCGLKSPEEQLFLQPNFLAVILLDHIQHTLLKGLTTQGVWHGVCADALYPQTKSKVCPKENTPESVMKAVQAG